MPLPPYDSLAPSIRRLPNVRAQYLDVTYIGTEGYATKYGVTDPRTGSTHVVTIVRNTTLCDHPARKGTTCSHILAVTTHYEKRNTMSTKPSAFYAPVPGNQSGSYEKKPFQQYAILNNGMYVGFLQRIFPLQDVPLEYRKKDKNTGQPLRDENGEYLMEYKQPVNFLVTHTIERDELPRFSLANARPKFTFFYSEEKNLSSTYFEIMHALVAKKYSCKELYDLYSDATNEKRPNLNQLVGFPVAFKLEASEYTAKLPDGTSETRVSHKASDFMPVSDRFTDILKKTREEFKFETDDKGFKVISHPLPGLHEDTSQDYDRPFDQDIEDDGIPF